MSERAVQELARLLRTALERDSYYNYGGELLGIEFSADNNFSDAW